MSGTAAERGVILIALLWVLTALSVFALSLAKESRVEVVAARNARDLSDAYYIARAGISMTVYQLIQRRFAPRNTQLELQGPPDPIDLGIISGDFANGSYEIEIQDESGKVNLNFVSEEQLRLLLEVCGIMKPDSDVIADSIFDWKDADPAHRMSGAEDDFYQSLPHPYRAKNGRFDTIEELLLVRGVNPRYFYGFREKDQDGNVVSRYGLSRYFTVYSGGNRVNINYAPLPVLMSVPGMSPQLAQAIVERRRTKPFVNLEEISRDMPATTGSLALPFLTTDHTYVYTLTARAHRQNSKVTRLVRAVVSIDVNEPARHKFIYWNENVPNL